ncbi:hypothetical protein C1I98_29365 [Spongiactinospora gelatinilytica]|uniref:Secreted protein n=1 Tax=Spongiactinospora gelatinilytica TaxID=2666298 RepID=A0A2W2FA28_9ACTN|nr:HAD domain-containing protein [Spongiactinospora gelatinilytica]PZG32451.1 hypothetical protein C1I98_29365 [Spongiactinospora gelatinilytica]
MAEQPLLLVDVDGVLNPTGRRSGDFRTYDCVIDGTLYKVRLSRAHGDWLLALARDTGSALVWATTWEDAANDWIGPRLGLPALPVIPMPPSAVPARGRDFGEMCKTPHVADYAAGRPFVWFDDAVSAADEDYLRARSDVGDFLLVEVAAEGGLTREDVARAAEWLAGLGRGT